ncbi:MAG: hypothetical protein H5T73_04940 [Actinobacteria bacterium]|nr:hypothetical protein [Actinomycetota bacterium]
MRRRLSSLPSLLLTAVFLAFSLFPSLFPSRGAVAQEATAAVSAYTTSYAYAAGEKVNLEVDMSVPLELRDEDLVVELLVYSTAITRSYLASFREETRRYPLFTRRLATIKPENELGHGSYEIEPSSWGLKAGVYPYEVRLRRKGETIASDLNFLVIMSRDAGYPLNLSLLWTLDFLPPQDALGNTLDGGLAAACSPSQQAPGFLFSLVKTLADRPALRSSFVIPPFIYQQMETMAGKPDAEKGEAGRGAESILASLRRLLESEQVDVVGTTYSFCDLDLFNSLGWAGEVEEQMARGMADMTESGIQPAGFVSPDFRLTDPLLQLMAGKGVAFTVATEGALQASSAGRQLLEGTSISQPVRFAASNGQQITGFVRDTALYEYLRTNPPGDSRHVIQTIVAELAVLQREKPYAIRSCVLAFPPSFLPDREFLEGFYGALDGCPWLQTRRLEELSHDQFPVEGVVVQPPEYTADGSEYALRLAAIRDQAAALSRAIVPEDHPLSRELARLVLLGMHHRFSDGGDVNAATSFLASLGDLMRGELSKISIGRKRSVTLSSTEGKLSVDVTSNLDFPVRATLRLENASLTFPEGARMEVQIEPRENRFVTSVSTPRKGSFLVKIALEIDGLVIDETTTAVNTSIINTLAIILLICLTALVALSLLVRRISRSIRGGKHARGRNAR